jgi:hypothetical protein
MVLQKLLKEIDPMHLSGTLIMLHVANIPAYSNRSVYRSPVDNKDLNRVFPGKKDGTLTERIAYTITEKIIKKSDYYIDLHSGEFNERVCDFVSYCYDCPNEELCKKTKELALAIGIKYLLPFRFNSDPGTYSDVSAIQLGVAAVFLEWGDSGIVKPEESEKGLKSILNVMRTIGMLKEEAIINKHPIYLTEETSLTGNYRGIFYPLVKKEQYVKDGMLLGYTTDYFGNILEKFVSPYSGLVVSVNNGPVINKGETAVFVAKINDEFEK